MAAGQKRNISEAVDDRSPIAVYGMVLPRYSMNPGTLSSLPKRSTGIILVARVTAPMITSMIKAWM